MTDSGRMLSGHNKDFVRIQPPVFVGGVGGSGTRILAALLKALGYNIGDDLNESLDNLWFTALFKRLATWSLEDKEFERLYTVFRAVSSGISSPFPINLQEVVATMLDPREQHALPWLRDRKTSLIDRLAKLQTRPTWGWKEPNSHIVARRILSLDPEIRYIHLARNGLDMAFSTNQNQLHSWGRFAMCDNCSDITLARSLAYWCWVEKRARQLLKDYPQRVLWIRYEDLWQHSAQVSKEIAQLLDLSAKTVAKILKQTVDTPLTTGRFRQHDTNCFRDEDMRFVASLGFAVQ